MTGTGLLGDTTALDDLTTGPRPTVHLVCQPGNGGPVEDWCNVETLHTNALPGTTTTRNLGDKAFPLTQAFHTYFLVGDINRVQVLGLENSQYLDKVDGGIEKTQVGAVAVTGEVDRIYLDVAKEFVINDAALNRRIRIKSSGSKSAVVWNPWVKISASMADLDDTDYQRLICVETTNAATDIVEVPAGGEFRLQAIYSVERD